MDNKSQLNRGQSINRSLQRWLHIGENRQKKGMRKIEERRRQRQHRIQLRRDVWWQPES